MRKSTIAVSVCLALAAFAAEAKKTYVLQAPSWGPSQAAAVARAGGQVKSSYASAGIAVVESDNPGFLAAALADGSVSSGAADIQVTAEPMPAIAVDENAVNPNDDRYYANIQWAPQAIEAPAAWAMGYTGAGVRVAVIDGGIYWQHPDLAGAVDVAASRSFVTEGIPGLFGCSPTAFDCDTGTFWHGTHVAGIIAARDNAIGVVGIAPGATIVGVKALHNGSGSFASVIDAILYSATDGGADIINMSLGAEFPKKEEGAKELIKSLDRAVKFATGQGVLVVVSAGNSGINFDDAKELTVVPAESGNAIAISATGPLGFALGATDFRRQASYTNFGKSIVHVAAPGGDFALPGEDLCTLPTTTVPVTVPCWAFDMVLSTSRAGYTWSAGTSMAAPAVSAVAALMKQKDPGMNPSKLANRIAQSADDEGKPGRDAVYGRGFLNARRAVSK
jgi:subtilisin family serine protease